jgi:hypothetical protein
MNRLQRQIQTYIPNEAEKLLPYPGKLCWYLWFKQSLSINQIIHQRTVIVVPLIKLGGSVVRDEERGNDFAAYAKEVNISNK